MQIYYWIQLLFEVRNLKRFLYLGIGKTKNELEIKSDQRIMKTMNPMKVFNRMLSPVVSDDGEHIPYQFGKISFEVVMVAFPLSVEDNF